VTSVCQLQICVRPDLVYDTSDYGDVVVMFCKKTVYVIWGLRPMPQLFLTALDRRVS
jgi:hypothetical protein